MKVRGSAAWSVGSKLVAGVVGACLLSNGLALAQSSDLAPTGKLRTTFLGTNMVQGHYDPATGVTTGVIADITKAMAKELGVPYEIYAAPNAAEIVKRLNAHESDIGFFASDPQRAKEVDFSRPYAEMYNAFVVASQSKFEKSADLDKPDSKIAAIKGQTQITAIGLMMKNADVVPFEHKLSQEDLEAMFVAGKIDAYGPNRQDAETIANASHGKLRVLSDNFLSVDQDIVVNKADAGKLPEINALLTKIIKDGIVKDSLARQGVIGVAAAQLEGQPAATSSPAPLHYGIPITGAKARELAAAARDKAESEGWAMAITVVDNEGGLIYFEKMDDTQSGSVALSMAKARTAALFKRPTKSFNDALGKGSTYILSMPNVMSVPGGFPLISSGKMVGAIGVSGGTNPQDEAVAQAALTVNLE